ncbi:MAG: histidine kinase [Thermoleophilia bacterium]|nr:histidine kinase [Thermoleophilia bacterium]
MSEELRPSPASAPPHETERVRHARLYLNRIRPIIVAVALLFTGLDLAVNPDALPAGTLAIVAGFALAQLPWTLLLHLGARPLLVVALSFVVDTAVVVSILFTVPTPEASAASLVIPLVVIGYFFSPRATIIYAVFGAVLIALVHPFIDAWEDPTTIPSASSLILVTGVLMAMHSARVRQSEDALERIVQEQRESLERLEQVDRSRNRLIANVSHELRTPLTSTIGSIETMLREDIELSDGDRHTLLGVAAAGGHRLLALVEDLLTLGATRPDSVRLDASEVHLASLAQDAVAGLEPQDAERAIRVDVLEDPIVHVDRMRMLQVIANLVVNAINHGRGTIVVESRIAPGHLAEVRVLDEGAGVDPRHLDELFLPFARFSDRPDSTGLGLAISRTIVEAHGGTLTYSRAGSRPCFTLRVPRIEAAERHAPSSQHATADEPLGPTCTASSRSCSWCCSASRWSAGSRIRTRSRWPCGSSSPPSWWSRPSGSCSFARGAIRCSSPA